jgi:hypothetical protein
MRVLLHPVRRALVEERGKTALAFFRDAHVRDQPRVLDVDALGRFARDAGDAERKLLRLALRERPALAEKMHGAIDGRIELIGRDAFVQQSDSSRGGGIEHLTADEIAPRLPEPDRRDHVRRDHRRHEPELDLAERELRGLGADRDVAARNEPDAATVGRAVDLRDRRLGEEVQRAHQRREPKRVLLICRFAGLRHAAHPAEIGAGRERRAGAGQHDAADVCVELAVEQCRREVGDQLVVEGVVHRRAVQLDFGDGAGAGD